MDAETIIPIFIFICIFSVPLMAIWTKHKREMAVLLGSQKSGLSEAETEGLRMEVKALRDKVNALTLEMDGVNALLRGMGKDAVQDLRESGELRDRL